MTSTDIYTILQSKPHNQHYLKRYVKLVNRIRQNKTLDEYTEIHHICPKASDLFPQFKDLRSNTWNKLVCQSREHFVLHWILWKIYGGSQREAFWLFNALKDINGRKVFKRLNSKTYALIKEEKYTFHTYTSIVTGEKRKLKSDDILVQTGEYIHFNKGREKSEHTRELLRKSREGVIDRMSPEKYTSYIEKLTIAGKNRIWKEETRQKIRNALIGKKAQDSTKQKHRETRSGQSYYVNNDGIRIRAKPDDIRLCSGAFQLDESMRNMGVYVNCSGERLKLKNSDPRVLSGEYVGVKSNKFKSRN